jgi:mRNA-degrading endonuclease RelE of RelBE toxin-antitoxin system
MVSRSRIKRLRGLLQPQYRLRVQDVRVYYDVERATVHILGVVAKLDSQRWLKEVSIPDEGSGSE